MTCIALLIAAAATAAGQPPPTPERTNALAFDNGAILVSDGGSYSSGIANWSTWHIADGDEQSGWCSPVDKPTGLAFVWDLDTTWRVDTFAVSTRNVQEPDYPGISAKTLDLYVSDGGAFSKVGSFEIGAAQRKEFPLPAGTLARQVKLVVVANHGHQQYSEVSEVELFGVRTAPVVRPNVTGDFSTNYGPLRFAQDGDEVFGCYDWTKGATVAGTILGRNVRVTWTEYPEDRVRRGTATFALTPGGQSIWGVWYEDGELRGEWAGPRVGPDEGPKCTPNRRSQLETLRKDHRLVLYGIRFDSNSDVPRPESEGTLDQLAAMLKQDPSLRVQVEGHTDSTNTDAFNLDLSQRRSQKVVAALVGRGIGASRLQAKGYGRSKPVADNATAQGRALNRRVEVSVLPQGR
jgi:outer membrane protein OmpA-like peptidoglycan-associated protein